MTDRAHGRALAGQERQAQGGRPLPPGQGQLRRRHQPAGHAVHVDPAQPGGPRPDQLDRRLGSAEALDGVVAVVTGELLAQHNLGLDADPVRHTHAVLPTDKVRITGRKSARDRQGPLYCRRWRGAVVVDYEPLPVIIPPEQSLEPGAPVSATTRKTSRQPHLPLGGRRRRRHRPGFRRGRRVVNLDTFYPRSTRPRWRPAAAWPTSTRSPARSPST